MSEPPEIHLQQFYALVNLDDDAEDIPYGIEWACEHSMRTNNPAYLEDHIRKVWNKVRVKDDDAMFQTLTEFFQSGHVAHQSHKVWKPVTQERYWNLVLWGKLHAERDGVAHLCGKPLGHRRCYAATEASQPTYAAVLVRADRRFECLAPLTAGEFMQLDLQDITIAEWAAEDLIPDGFMLRPGTGKSPWR